MCRSPARPPWNSPLLQSAHSRPLTWRLCGTTPDFPRGLCPGDPGWHAFRAANAAAGGRWGQHWAPQPVRRGRGIRRVTLRRVHLEPYRTCSGDCSWDLMWRYYRSADGRFALTGPTRAAPERSSSLIRTAAVSDQRTLTKPELPSVSEETHVTWMFVYIDATMFHRWSPPWRHRPRSEVWRCMRPRVGGQPLPLLYTPPRFVIGAPG